LFLDILLIEEAPFLFELYRISIDSRQDLNKLKEKVWGKQQVQEQQEQEQKQERKDWTK